MVLYSPMSARVWDAAHYFWLMFSPVFTLNINGLIILANKLSCLEVPPSEASAYICRWASCAAAEAGVQNTLRQDLSVWSWMYAMLVMVVLSLTKVDSGTRPPLNLKLVPTNSVPLTSPSWSVKVSYVLLRSTNAEDNLSIYSAPTSYFRTATYIHSLKIKFKITPSPNPRLINCIQKNYGIEWISWMGPPSF